jgi:hypothetical protein
LNKAVEFEDNRTSAVRARRRGGLAAAILLTALATLSCDRSKVVIELYWEKGAITTSQTKVSVAFQYPNDKKEQRTTETGMLPSEPPLTLIYWVDDPSKKIDVFIEVKGPNDESLLSDEAPWTGEKIKWCVGTWHDGASKCPAPDGGVEPDAAGGKGGGAAGGQPGMGGAGMAGAGAGGVMGAGGEVHATGGASAGGSGAGGKPVISTGGRPGDGGKGMGGSSIMPIGGAKGSGGMTGSGGIAAGGSPGSGGVGVGGSAFGGTVGTGGMVATGGSSSSGGSAGTGGSPPPPPSCLTDSTVTCKCEDYCETLGTSCASSDYFLPNTPATKQDCLASCAGFAWTGGFNDPLSFGNTLGCRVAQAKANKCTAASATGGNVCGVDRCYVYCDALQQNCSGSLHPFAGTDPYGSCLKACTHPSNGWDWDRSENLSTTSASGDLRTGNCRLYWAGQAGSIADKATACQKAGPQSAVCQ